MLALWVGGTAGALLYAHLQHIAWQVVAALLPALLVEVSFYAALGFAQVREQLLRLGRKLPAALLVSALAPYLIFSILCSAFVWIDLAVLATLAAAAALWYRTLPRHLITDLAFLLLMATVFLGGIFPLVYANPFGKPSLDILGRLMWIRLGISAVLLERGVEGVDFGFLPRAQHWRIGARYFFYAAPLILPVALGIGFAQRPLLEPTAQLALKAAGTFLGMLWVVALAEEFFFRGLLQQWLAQSLGNRVAGLILASLLFGVAHLGFRSFPNWKFALLATIAGVFYGLAYLRSGSIRASMVTHALVNTTWRVIFG